jgi:L-threonylcarbamoyladenylate synthase
MGRASGEPHQFDGRDWQNPDVPSTRVISVDPDHPDPAIIAEAAAILRAGGLVAFATETVYGLGADVTNPSAVARIFEAKGRPSTNPLIVHVESKEAALACVADWPDRADLLADRFWPGPLTLVLPRSSIIPDIVTAGQETVGVRVPRPQVARWLILEAGRPIAAPSANRSMGVSPTTAQHVIKDLDGKVDLILDSGPTTVGIESTVLDLSTGRPRVLRPGEVTAEQLSHVLGESVESSSQPAEPVRSPGQMAVHYAPETMAFWMERDQVRSGLMPTSFQILIIGDVPDALVSLPAELWNTKLFHLSNPELASRDLYATLHKIDAFARDFLIIIPPPDEPCWRAVRDRIWRATQPWPGRT